MLLFGCFGEPVAGERRIIRTTFSRIEQKSVEVLRPGKAFFCRVLQKFVR
jgi:hypothetical protein